MSYALEQAVQNKSLYMVFQPIYNSIGDQVYGFESLVWWEDRELGFVPPDIFIGVAEKSNLIHRLSDVIQNKIWDFTGKINEVNKGLYISINISGKELSRPDFAERFIENARQKYIEPSNIGIEVTESSMINNLELAEKQLLRLKQEGFQIYLDDFGTGYSSLSYLYKLPIDVLKIDKSFIDQIITEKNKEYLLRGIIQLARQLSIETLAEGVETEKQVEILKNIGVDYIQGYYYSKPLSFDDALKLLQ
jgi:EAL domain-containing protein (putative c-di-GMP-specific phosphodiesterase class I)